LYFSEKYTVELIERPYQSFDIDGADSSDCTLNDRSVFEQVATDAKSGWEIGKWRCISVIFIYPPLCKKVHQNCYFHQW
jgi:hypothetical protein